MPYSEERKAAVLAEMRPPRQQTIAALAKREGIAAATLYKWRSEARDQGQLLPNSARSPTGWSSDDKFNAVLETATLSESETAEYGRRHGLYPEQIAQWRMACTQANDRADQAALGERAARVIAASSCSPGMMVSDLSLGIMIHLSSIGFAQADDAPTFGAIHEYHHVQAQADVADAAPTRLAVGQ